MRFGCIFVKNCPAAGGALAHNREVNVVVISVIVLAPKENPVGIAEFTSLESFVDGRRETS